MATTSRKASRILFFSKEAPAGTLDTYAFFEGRTCTLDFPEPTYLREADNGKLGAGEHGTITDVQAVFTPFTIKCQRFSEVAYLMAYALGQADSTYLLASGATRHRLTHQLVTARTQPTFTMCYGDTLASMTILKHCIINEATVTLAAGGNGVIDASFSGFCNMHYDNAGVITINAASNQSSWTAKYDLATEPLINYKACTLWLGTALTSVPLVISTIGISTEDLAGTPTDISALLDSVTFGIANGITGEDLLRASGGGVLNNQERGDRTFTLELKLRRDTSVQNFRTLIDADTQRALELQFYGPTIVATEHRYAFDIFWPVVSFLNATEDGAAPIATTIPCTVFQGTDGIAFDSYWQSAIAGGYNATNT